MTRNRTAAALVAFLIATAAAFWWTAYEIEHAWDGCEGWECR